MNRHPVLENLIDFSPDDYTLDMGAGDGSSGCSVCVDIAPQGENVIRADMLNLPFNDNTFDGVLSQCAFYVSGDPQKAMEEAMRVLKPGGKLLLQDVFFNEPDFEYDMIRDETAAWKEFFFEQLWSDDSICLPEVKGKCRYYQIVRIKR